MIIYCCEYAYKNEVYTLIQVSNLEGFSAILKICDAIEKLRFSKTECFISDPKLLKINAIFL